MTLALGNIARKYADDAEVGRFKKHLPGMFRAALEGTFKYWHEKYAKLHFSRAAYMRYPDEYRHHFKKNLEKFKKRYLRRIESGGQSTNPLVATGALKQAFLYGSYRFRGNSYRIVADWPHLPTYSYIDRSKNFSKAKAVTAVNAPEAETLAKVFDSLMAKQIKQFEKSRAGGGGFTPLRTYGAFSPAI